MDARDLMEPRNSPRVMFYVQHLLGIGHLMRARRIAQAMHNKGLSVTLVTGGLPVAGFELSGVNQIALPAMAVSDGSFGELVDIDGRRVDESFRDNRCRRLLEAFNACNPDIVMLEAFPFGRRQLRFELLPLLMAIKTRVPKPVLVTSIRDILQKNRKAGRDEETVQLINEHFDTVLVHGDPAFATLEETFTKARDIAAKVTYTGLVCGPPPLATAERFDVVVSAGGGAVGAMLLRASMDAAARLPELKSWCAITGPYFPQNEFEALATSAPPGVTVERFRHDFTGLLGTTQLSISQAGYNTVSDVLQAGCRALLLPFSSHGETEQADRAERLQQLGLASVLSDEIWLSEQSNGKKLATIIQKILLEDPPAVGSTINTEGGVGTALVLQELFDLKRR